MDLLSQAQGVLRFGCLASASKLNVGNQDLSHLREGVSQDNALLGETRNPQDQPLTMFGLTQTLRPTRRNRGLWIIKPQAYTFAK